MRIYVLILLEVFMAEEVISKSLKRLERRNLIIDKTFELIAQNGIDGVSIAEIAKATQLGHGQIYRIFQDKMEILKYVIDQVTQKRLILFHLGNHNLQEKAKQISSVYKDDLSSHQIKLIYELMKLNHHHPLFTYVQEAEKKMMEVGMQILRHKYPHANENQILALSEIVAIFTEGSLLRRLSGFSNQVQIEILEQMFLSCFYALEEMIDTTEQETTANTSHKLKSECNEQ